jgi:uncharacterized protein
MQPCGIASLPLHTLETNSMAVWNSFLEITLAAAPWLLFGLLAGGLIKAYVPESILKRWVGGKGPGGIIRAAVIGAPLPLCSCGAIPMALALHRGGAGRGPTTAFLIGTPGIGVDSIALSYALLGPFMAMARALGAVLSAITTGLLVATTRGKAPQAALLAAACGCKGSCSVGQTAAHAPPPMTSFAPRLRAGMHFAFNDLFDDIKVWILGGLVFAGILMTYAPPQTLATYGSGIGPMLLMAVVGIPLYICATAATPIAAGMVLAGVSPGTVLVFLLAGPITSMATLGVFRREMGNAALGCYLLGILPTAVLLGLLVDHVVLWAGVDVVGQIATVRELLPAWVEWTALSLLVLLAVRPARQALVKLLPE